MQHGRPPAPSRTALVVEDERELQAALCSALRRWGFQTYAAGNAAQALQQWRAAEPEIVLLDLGLPDMDGLDVLHQARTLGFSTPVLVLTARVTPGDCILGLNFGADAYLAKPFDFDELQARVLALVRRASPPPDVSPAAPPPAPAQLGRLHWSPDAREFYCGGERIALSGREAALLRALLERPQYARPREALLHTVFPRGGVLDEALEVVAYRLRRKLARCGVVVVTLRGLGYLIKAQD